MSNICQGIVFSDKAYNAIIDEAFKMHPNETGGILLGHILDNGYWVVMEVIPPGWKSVSQVAYFEYDQQFVNYLAESVSTQYGQSLDVLGLWHRHPGSMDTFSRTDDGTNCNFAQLRAQGVVSGLVNIDPDFRLTMYHVTAAGSRPHYERIPVNVGDDIIPEEYFRLRHYPARGENPSITQKKNEVTAVPLSQRSSNDTESGGTETTQDTACRKRFFPTRSSTILVVIIGLLLGFAVGQSKGYNDSEAVPKSKYEKKVKECADLKQKNTELKEKCAKLEKEIKEPQKPQTDAEEKNS